MIDIKMFMLISIEKFDDLVIELNLNLTPVDDIYLITYIVVNLTAYIVLFIFFKVLFTIYYKTFHKGGNIAW